MSVKVLNQSDAAQRAWRILFALPLVWGVISVGQSLTARYSIGIDDQKDLCLKGHHRLFLIDHWDRTFQKEDLIAFKADNRMTPFFSLETIFIKRVKGVEGDEVGQRGDILTVNGQEVGEGFPLTNHPGVTQVIDHRPFKVQPLTYWAMGDQPKSFDSRYWGVVYQQQVVGKAYVLSF